jgi:hypothetical protein
MDLMEGLDPEEARGTLFFMEEVTTAHSLAGCNERPEFKQLMGLVEVDETFIGEKEATSSWERRQYQIVGSGRLGVLSPVG